MPERGGYLAAGVGAVVGGTIGAVVGFVLGILYVDTFTPNAELEGIVPPFYGATAMSAIGVGIGTWLALRMRDHARAGVTGVLAAVLGPLMALVALWGVEIAADDIFRSNTSEWLAPAAAAVAAAVTASVVRAVTVPRR